MRVLSIDGDMATIAVEGLEQRASLALVPDAGVGDWVLVHAGYAINVLAEQEARETLALLAELEDPTSRSARTRMKAEALHRLAADLAAEAGAGGTFMEVCGTHTMAIARHGLRELLPPGVRLVSGPGCPVCVTAMRDLDRAIALCGLPEVTVDTFGDLMRVPASRTSLAAARAAGADVRVVYSPRDALDLAAAEPSREVVFVGIGFETTAPTMAAAVLEARRRGVRNFSVLALHKTMPPALRALLDLGETPIAGFLLPGHVSVITGSACFEFLAAEYGVAGVVVGFEPADILEALLMLGAADHAGRREPVHEGRAAAGQHGRAGADATGVRAARRGLARPRRDPRLRSRSARRVRRPRRGAALRRGRRGTARAGRVPLRRGPARRHRPGGVPALRAALHAGGAGRRLHGQQRGRLRRPLQVPGSR